MSAGKSLVLNLYGVVTPLLPPLLPFPIVLKVCIVQEIKIQLLQCKFLVYFMGDFFFSQEVSNLDQSCRGPSTMNSALAEWPSLSDLIDPFLVNVRNGVFPPNQTPSPLHYSCQVITGSEKTIVYWSGPKNEKDWEPLI